MRKGFSYFVLGAAILFLALLLIPGQWFPESQALKQSRRTTACLSNMRQLSMATLLYAEENDESLPYVYAATGPTALGWAARIEPHLKLASYVNPHHVFREHFDPGAFMSYGMNANVAQMPKLSSHSDPERSVLLFDVEGTRRGRDGSLDATFRLSPVGDGARDGLVDSTDVALESATRLATGAFGNSGLPGNTPSRHGDRANIALLNGSIRRLPPLHVSAGANAKETKNPEVSGGCSRSDLPGLDRPCAEGAHARKRRFTFSLR